MKNKRLFEIEQDIRQFGGITVSFCIEASDLNELYFLLYQKGYKKGTYTVKEFLPESTMPTEVTPEPQMSLFG
ncbi:MAG: hypothetical protein MJZ25_05355 [Fibrobacter sp.]|nr:hypothetical protein [Fibrobacter sp.]